MCCIDYDPAQLDACVSRSGIVTERFRHFRPTLVRADTSSDERNRFHGAQLGIVANVGQRP